MLAGERGLLGPGRLMWSTTYICCEIEWITGVFESFRRTANSTNGSSGNVDLKEGSSIGDSGFRDTRVEINALDMG